MYLHTCIYPHIYIYIYIYNACCVMVIVAGNRPGEPSSKSKLDYLHFT